MKTGERLPDLEREIDLAQLVAYGAATWDWHRIHYDPEHARRAGMRAPVVDGQMFGALLAEQLRRAFPPGVRITRLHYRNRAPVYPGDRIRCEGEVTRIDGRVAHVAQRVRVEDRLVVEPAGAELDLPEA